MREIGGHMLPGNFFNTTTRWQRIGVLFLSSLPLLIAQAPPEPNTPQPDETADNRPGRGVARVSVVAGEVSVRRGDSGDWVAAAPNAPLVVQDTLHSGVNSRAEVQMDRSNIIRVAPDSEIRFAELEYQRFGIQVASGTVSYRVLRELEADVEVSTPIASVRPTRHAAFRVTVRPDGTTEITVRAGDVEVATAKGTERLSSGRTMLIRGTSTDPEFQLTSAIRRDEWDQWNENRDRELEKSNAYKYVSSSVYGAEDLDQNGRWEYDPPYGNVWVPTVAADWAPYRNGQWSWIDYYGWSWVSYDSWGWAPYHYGRWYHGPRGWCWWPGSIGARHYWSPGLVAWVGFGGGGVGFGRVGWVPLAPYEPYHPWYGWNYYRGGGRYGGTHIVNNVNITNVYRNARVNNGMTAVNSHDFTAGRAVRNVRLSAGDMQQGNLMRGQLPIAPERASQRLAERQLSSTPNSAARSSFYSRRGSSGSSSNGMVPFDQQQRNVQEMSRRVMNGGSSAASIDSGRSGSGRRADSLGGNAGAAGERSVNPSQRSNERLGTTSPQTDRGGWRRFGDPASSGGASSRSGEASANPSSTRNSAEGWRRFGDPGARGAASTSGSDSRTGQRTFESQSPAFGSGNRRSPDSSSSSTPSGPRYQSPRSSPSGRGSSGESIGVSPSIVRERTQRQPSYSAPAPSMRGGDSGSSGRSGGFSAPTRSAPSFNGGSRGGSAPSGGSGGGGARSGGGGSRGGRGR